jgi:hypothetical protein
MVTGTSPVGRQPFVVLAVELTRKRKENMTSVLALAQKWRVEFLKRQAEGSLMQEETGFRILGSVLRAIDNSILRGLPGSPLSS